MHDYPLAPNLMAHWTRTEESGVVEFSLGDTGRVLGIAYVGYRPPGYFLGSHYLGTFTLDGRALNVTEHYRYHTVTNTGSVKLEDSASSSDGQAVCSEIIMSLQGKRKPALQEVETGIWELAAQFEVDQSYHEVESDKYRCKARLDVAKGELVLHRSYFRDSST